jgi:hypothetical protein
MLECSGFFIDVRFGELRDTVDPDLLWRSTEGEGMAVPENDICRKKFSEESKQGFKSIARTRVVA